MVRELYKKNSDYTIYQADHLTIISVVFFGLVNYQRSFYLLPNEISTDYESLSNLPEQIRNNYDNYKGREVVPAITRERDI